MQHRIVSKLNAAFGVALLLSAAAVLPAASRNYPQIVPPAQAVKNATAQSYDFVPIDAPGSPCYTSVGGMNNQRLATVEYSPDCWSSNTMLWQNGQFSPLPQALYPTNPSVSIEAVNNGGTLFGNFGDSNTQHAAALQLNTGKLTVLPDIPGMPYNWGNAISDSGNGVGWACDTWWLANCAYWMWNGKSYTPLSFDSGLPLGYQYPSGINNKGQIVWFVSDQNWYQHAYLQDGTKSIYLDVPGSYTTMPGGINNSGNVALSAFFTDFVQLYLWRNGVFTAIPNVPTSWGSLSNMVFGTNDRGDYWGQWLDDKQYSWHGFIAFKQ